MVDEECGEVRKYFKGFLIIFTVVTFDLGGSPTSVLMVVHTPNRDAIFKKKTTVDQIIAKFDQIKEENIWVHAEFKLFNACC